jgi:hypothetical protein
MLRIDVFFAAKTAFSSSSCRAVLTRSFARQSTVCVFNERFDATKWFTRSSSVCGRLESNDRLESALLVDEAGEGGEAIVEALYNRQVRVMSR